MSFQIKTATRQGARRITVPLSGGLVAFIDETDAPAVTPFKWTADKGRRTIYAVRMDGKKKIYLHRQLLSFPSCRVDHRDRNGLNCSRDNLRHSTGSQNSANSGKKGSSSQFKGVGWDSGRGAWKAQIKVNYKGCFLGRFKSETDAARAYDFAAHSAWGEFAQLNFP